MGAERKTRSRDLCLNYSKGHFGLVISESELLTGEGQNDNHSPGPGPGRLVPSSHQRSEHHNRHLQQRRYENLEVNSNP